MDESYRLKLFNIPVEALDDITNDVIKKKPKFKVKKFQKELMLFQPILFMRFCIFSIKSKYILLCQRRIK